MESDYIIEDTDIRRLIVKAVEAREMPGTHSLRLGQHSWLAGRILRMQMKSLAERQTAAIEMRMNTECSRAVI